MRMNANNLLLSIGMVAFLGGCASTTANPERETSAASQLEGSAATGTEKDSLQPGKSSAKSGDSEVTGTPEKGKDLERNRLFPGTGVFLKSPAKASSAVQPGEITLNFEGADLREVVRVVLGDMMAENYVVDPRVQGTVTVHTSQPLARDAVIPTLDSLLRMNGAALVRDGGVYRVVPAAGALRGSATPQVGGAGAALQPGYSVQVIPLQFIGAKEMVKILEPLVPEGSIVRVDETRNLLMLAGAEKELIHALETVEMFDVDWLAGMSVGLFTLQNVEIKAIMPELQTLFGDNAKGPFSGLVRVIPIERLNALFVVTPRPKYLELARVWVDRLDKSGKSGGVKLYVYPVQNSNAEKVAGLLSGIFGGKGGQAQSSVASVAPGLSGTEIQSSFGQSGSGQAQAMSGQGASSLPRAGVASAPSSQTLTGVGGGLEVKVIADKDNNALLIMANAAQYETIENALRKLDTVPRQVLIEVTIAEITLAGKLSYGLDWFFNNAINVTGQQNYGGGLPSAPNILPTALQPFSAVWRGASGDVKAVLSLLASQTKVNVLSSPHLMVADNQTAKIQVGNRVPTVSQTQSLATTATTTGLISSVQYIDTGVLLSVRPHINASGLVAMEVNQEVSDATRNTISGIDSPTISKRSIQSSVTVQTGETMVMGGLITDKKANSSGGLPLLSEIPVLGGLFGTQTDNSDRTELIVLITPRVVNDSRQAREVTEEFRKKMSKLQFKLPKEELAEQVGPSSGVDLDGGVVK